MLKLSSRPRKHPMKRIRLYLFYYFTGTVLLLFAYRTLDRLTRGSPSDWQSILIEQATGVYGTAVLLLLIVGVAVIVVNYLAHIPGVSHGSPWGLVAGLVMIFAGFLMATRYR